jgi:hypothetical protein
LGVIPANLFINSRSSPFLVIRLKQLVVPVIIVGAVVLVLVLAGAAAASGFHGSFGGNLTGVPPEGWGANSTAGHGMRGTQAPCPGANLTDDVRAQFEQARADGDFEALKSLREEYCPLPKMPEWYGNRTCARDGRPDFLSAIGAIRERLTAGDIPGALAALDGLEEGVRAMQEDGPGRGPCGPHGGPAGSGTEGAGANATAAS